MRVKPFRFLILLCFAFIFNAQATQVESPPLSYAQSAQIVLDTYERKLFTLSPTAESHFALRMYRQTLDKKYLPALWTDMAQVASRLNRFANEVVKSEEIILYSFQRLGQYQSKNAERSQRRYTVSKHHPEYLYLGVELLSAMARADEYGLKHKNDDILRAILRRYDFTHYVTDQEMIEAWAAQLANQVYWLRQLGEQDIVDDFTQAFKATYPNNKDTTLSTKQYWNKIYGLTHIIFADSQYYQRQIKEDEHQWIYDYFRKNINHILLRCKEDVIAEVGIAFLLAGLDRDPVVTRTRNAIRAAISSEQGMIPSAEGKFDLSSGEHRNILAIMLLNWQGVNQGPDYQTLAKSLQSIPYGLVPKNQQQ